MKAVKHRNKLRARRARRTRKKVQGTQDRPRISFYRSNKYNYAQAINDEMGHTIASVSHKDLDGNKLSSASKVDRARELGKILAKKMKEANVGAGVFDRREYRYHGRTKAFVEGLREGGVSI